MQAELILNDASRLAASRNERVVKLALHELFRRAKIALHEKNFEERKNCSCKYWSRRHEFSTRCRRVAAYKRAYEVAKKQDRGDWNYDNGASKSGFEINNDLYANKVKWEDEREMLNKIRPCDKCILFFNPTGKRRFMGQTLGDPYDG